MRPWVWLLCCLPLGTGLAGPLDAPLPAAQAPEGTWDETPAVASADVEGGTQPGCCLAPGMGLAGPLEAPLTAGQAPEGAWDEDPSVAGPDVRDWVEHELRRSLLQMQAAENRQAVLAHGWRWRPPTWIQDAATINLGDFPSLEDPTERAERDLRTLEWVIEEQRRAAAARSGTPLAVAAADDAHWLRRLLGLPRDWGAALKAHRDWLAAGGTLLALLLGVGAAFARRPTRAPAPAAGPAPRRHRHRHRHHRRHRHHASVPTGTAAAPPLDALPLPR